MPHLWPTGSSSRWPPSITARYFSSCPSDSTSRWTPCPPGTARTGFRSTLACFRLSPSCPFRLLHTYLLSRPARHYPRVWIQHSSFERRRDLNPPEQRAAQRTLWASPTPCRAAPRLCLPEPRWLLSLPHDRSPRLLGPIFPRALSPTIPEGPIALACCFTIGLWLRPSKSRIGHLRFPIETESGSLALRLACWPPQFASPITETHPRSATC